MSTYFFVLRRLKAPIWYAPNSINGKNSIMFSVVSARLKRLIRYPYAKTIALNPVIIAKPVSMFNAISLYSIIFTPMIFG